MNGRHLGPILVLWSLATNAHALDCGDPGTECTGGETCNGLAADCCANSTLGVTLVGTTGDDVIVGGPGSDTIYGQLGNDTICGEAGDDELWGRDGADHVKGGDGNDVIMGGDGQDALYGGPDEDWIAGGRRADEIYGGDGPDWLWGESGPDTIRGGAGDDEIHGGGADDTLYGQQGDDQICGSDGDDDLNGGDNSTNGYDLLCGGDDFDAMHGGDGTDVLVSGECTGVAGGESDGVRDNFQGDADDDICYESDADIEWPHGTSCETEIDSDLIPSPMMDQHVFKLAGSMGNLCGDNEHPVEWGGWVPYPPSGLPPQ